MAKITAGAFDAATLEDLLLAVARVGATAAVDELLTQGVAVLGPTDDHLAAAIRDHAQAVAQQTADGLSLAASRRAVQLAQGRTAEQLAGEVTGYLRDLEHRWERDQLTGAVQQASNAGRFLVFDRVPGEAPVRYHASELLDAATCAECTAIDGQEFDTLAGAMAVYPSGGYMDCRGGPRCRGTVVAVLPESEPDPEEVLRRPDLWGGG